MPCISRLAAAGKALGAVGIALFGSIGLAIYRSGVVEGISPEIPPEAAVVAQDTLGGAVEVAGDLPAELGAPLIEAANAAFVQGVHVTAVISALGTLALALFAVFTIRRRDRSGGGQLLQEADQGASVEAA